VALASPKLSAPSGRTYRVAIAEYKAQTEDLVHVQGIRVENPDIHLPFSEVVRFHEIDTRWKLLFSLLSLGQSPVPAWLRVLRSTHAV